MSKLVFSFNKILLFSFAAMYKLLRGILFLFDPESVHYFSMDSLKRICGIRPFRNLVGRAFTPPDEITNFAGIRFRNKIGLGAGFDKNAVYLRELETLGFGFVEIGTVTPMPQPGNDKPRLFRLKAEQALINRMGFNNVGADVVAQRLETWRKNHPKSTLIVGGNIGKNKSTPNEEAWKDYLQCFKKLYPFVDYFVVNVSSPNTEGLRALQEKEALRKILTGLQNYRSGMKVSKPIFLKIAPDLSLTEMNDVVALAVDISLDGLVGFNTTLNRSLLGIKGKEKAEAIGAGGLSGKPLQEFSAQQFKYLSAQCANRIPLIASGGIFTGEDALKRLNDGAGLLQVFTGFIYEGPGIVKNISKFIAGKN